jgi:hypothetical protein
MLTSLCFPPDALLLARDDVSRCGFGDIGGSRLACLSGPFLCSMGDDARSPLCGDIWLLASSTTRSVSLFSPSLSYVTKRKPEY